MVEQLEKAVSQADLLLQYIKASRYTTMAKNNLVELKDRDAQFTETGLILVLTADLSGPDSGVDPCRWSIYYVPAVWQAVYDHFLLSSGCKFGIVPRR